MAHPRYASAGARLNLTPARSLAATVVATLAVVLALPALNHNSGNRLAAATENRPAAATGPDSSSATPAPQPQATGVLSAIDIHPSKVVAAAPAMPAAPAPPVAAGVFGPAGDVGALGIPTMVLQAYHLAADRLAKEQPACKLPWWLLAGIGHTESGHAESGRLYADGTTRGKILGPRLNGGIAGDAIITDTDHGKYDGDTVYDRAVGPMQFIPSTWVHWGVDANGDGKADPSNIYDATVAAGRYLCADGRNLATLAGLTAAVLSYNHSAPYLATVLAWGYAYRDGALALADSPYPVVSDVTKVRPPITSRPPAHKPAKGTSSPSSTPSGSPSGTPTPTATSTPPSGCPTSVSTSSPASPSSTPASSSAAASSAAASSAAASSAAASSAAASQAASASQSADGGSASAPASQTDQAAATASSSASSSSPAPSSSSPTGCVSK